MNFIWDVTLRAEAEGIERREIFYRQADTYSPYYEHAFPLINQSWVKNPQIEINALYRFSLLVEELLHPDALNGLRYGEISSFISHFFDTLLHYLCEMTSGMGLPGVNFMSISFGASY